MAKRKAKAARRGAGGARTARAAKRTRRAKSSGSAGISRIDQESTRTHGYFVRVGYHRTKDGAWRPKHRAFFGDASHGGKTKALTAATKWLKSVSKK